ncbi:NUDIX hydrolase [Corallococcus sp. CA049B]|uniref:NUDIX hydrolase n=1 Tax=Corallococcus sp. CA049B TaxID=2316730 RepID=UPI000EA0D860|nr:NUDIX hydrolase [Corallococcus sp. CA049B]NOJ95238.1 NUDIX hydrolase [Corallococcus coralloides]RKG79323.1 NUDIX hydrolase [Corallococcus sp. CA049B]
MTARHPWEGDVRARLYERVRERGDDTLTAFAEARPAAPLHRLADEPGEDDVAAVQVFSGLLAEAEQSRRVTRLVRDVFVRELSDEFPDGWPAVVDDEARMNVAIALGRWSGYMPETHQERVERASDVLLSTPPSPGWRPLAPDDELLRMLLPDEEA